MTMKEKYCMYIIDTQLIGQKKNLKNRTVAIIINILYIQKEKRKRDAKTKVFEFYVFSLLY